MTEHLYQTQRIRHELRLRLLTVSRIEQLSIHMRRITFTGDALDGFISAAHDDHVKLFFPAAGSEQPILPQFGQAAEDDAPRPIARNYTPRRYDAINRELDIDFYLHGDGPASSWATQARPGQTLGIGGPRGSLLVSKDFDWYLLIGDETALPAIARRLEELPVETKVIALISIADSRDQIPLQHGTNMQIEWIRNNDQETTLLKTLQMQALPDGTGYAWIATELSQVQPLRYCLLDKGMNKTHIHAASYWRNGVGEHHQTHDE
ncbi:siderophore-interacting protein [Undibacterium sp. RuTC16W]|uniref:siderophore-interacting protein n=1 Tax=Undibacterium sp. RuTC16W TaxID=3413048 RepID=UPI003BF40DDA